MVELFSGTGLRFFLPNKSGVVGNSGVAPKLWPKLFVRSGGEKLRQSLGTPKLFTHCRPHRTENGTPTFTANAFS